VLEAAVALFGEHGYAAVRVDDVAMAAGVTRGAVYHHFRDKQGLFAAAVGAVQSRVSDAVVAAADSEPDAWRALTAGCRAFLAASVDDAHRRIMLIDAPAVMGWAAWRALDAEHSGSHLAQALAALDDAGLLRVPSCEAAGAMVSGALNEAALWVVDQANQRALPEAYATLDLLLASLRRSDD
jgi:AcrR family transcriptional regulator